MLLGRPWPSRTARALEVHDRDLGREGRGLLPARSRPAGRTTWPGCRAASRARRRAARRPRRSPRGRARADSSSRVPSGDRARCRPRQRECRSRSASSPLPARFAASRRAGAPTRDRRSTGASWPGSSAQSIHGEVRSEPARHRRPSRGSPCGTPRGSRARRTCARAARGSTPPRSAPRASASATGARWP